MKLDIQQLNVSLQKHRILSNVSLTVQDGEFLSLLGASGCGKSTLLKTIAGILPADSGRVQLGDQEITTLPAHKRGTVIVFQDLRLFPHMSVAENVAFAQKMQGIGKAERLRSAEEFLEKVQLSGYGNRRIAQLSGGQQQRVALARALAARPRLLLLDEPFSALDESLRKEMRTLVYTLHKELGMTTVLVTHDKEEALSLSDRVALMCAGEIVQCDVPEVVYHHPSSRFVADYFGGSVYLHGQVREQVFFSAEVSCPVDIPNGSYAMLLRPHALHTDRPGGYRLTVTEMHFCGAMTRVVFHTPEGVRWEKSYAEKPAWKVGETISCHIELSEAVFFPEEINA